MKLGSRRVLGLLAAVALLAGCGEESGVVGDKKRGPDMNLQEAAVRADAILDGTISAIRPEVQWSHGETTVGTCDLTRRRVVMTVISESRRGSFLGLIQRYWQKSGYRINDVNSSAKFPAIFAQSADGFGITLTVGGEGQAFFDIDSPCVRESPVSDPTTEHDGPDYRGGPIPRPNVRSDFWSAESSGQPSPSAP